MVKVRLESSIRDCVCLGLLDAHSSVQLGGDIFVRAHIFVRIFLVLLWRVGPETWGWALAAGPGAPLCALGASFGLRSVAVVR
jgi:hypothetical protein